MPENVDAIALFAAASTQWRYAFSGVRTGLDYSGVESMIRMHGIDPDSETFSKIQILERELIAVDRENHAEQNRRP